MEWEKLSVNHISDKRLISRILKELLQLNDCNNNKNNLKMGKGASLVAQWLGIRLPMQGTQVQALVREDPTCCRATKPMSHSY